MVTMTFSSTASFPVIAKKETVSETPGEEEPTGTSTIWYWVIAIIIVIAIIAWIVVKKKKSSMPTESIKPIK